MSYKTTLDQFKGCLVGTAVGDALGAPVEFILPQNRREQFGPVTDYLPGSLKAGQWTDDTELSVALARTLAESHGLDMGNFSAKLKDWYRWSDPNRFPGVTTRSACAKLMMGADWETSGDMKSEGTGGAMRVSPIGLFYDDEQQMTKAAFDSSRITHANPKALLGAAMIAYVVNLCSRGRYQNESSFLDELAAYTNKTAAGLGLLGTDDLVDKIRNARKQSYEKGIREISPSGAVLSIVPGAIYTFLSSPDDIERSLINAASHGPDPDTLGAMVGAISGSHNGHEKIPKRWLTNLEAHEQLVELAERLFQAKESTLAKA